MSGVSKPGDQAQVFDIGETVVRRDMYRCRTWSEQALRVIEDSDTALVTACRPGAEALWPSLYAKAHTDGARTMRIEAFDAMAAGEWELERALTGREHSGVARRAKGLAAASRGCPRCFGLTDDISGSSAEAPTLPPPWPTSTPATA